MLGTVVTGAGPHSGDANAADRMDFDPETVSQLHADVVFLLVGLTVALLVALYATDSPDRIRRAARDLLVVQLAQGVVGFVQYFTDLPIVLVLLHMLGAVLITAFTARLVWSVRGPASDVPLDSPAQPADRQPAEPGARQWAQIARNRSSAHTVGTPDEDHGGGAVDGLPAAGGHRLRGVPASAQAGQASSSSCQTSRPPGRYVTTGHPDSTSASTSRPSIRGVPIS